jgi:hypothetical protein
MSRQNNRNGHSTFHQPFAPFVMGCGVGVKRPATMMDLIGVLMLSPIKKAAH